jgi:sec-independent protein translocase protein TatC
VKFWKRKRKGAEGDNAQMSLIDHLRELRNRVIKCALVAVVGGAVSYAFYDQIYRFFTHPYCVSVHKLHRACKLYSFDPLSGFLLRMKVAGYGGLILAIPVILWQLWRFIMPGLYKNERRYSAAFVLSSTLLFAGGATLAYVTLPPMLRWLESNGGPVTYLSAADKYFWLSAIMMLAFGIGFEFPVLLVALQLVGILQPSVLAKHRRYALCGIVLAVAVLTPGGDPISLIALSAPLCVFYEGSILVGRIALRRRAKAAAAVATEAASAESLSADG